MASEYIRTAFIGQLNGQYKIVQDHLPKALGRCTSSYIMGNILGFNEYASDHQNVSPNERTLKTIQLLLMSHSNMNLLIGPNELQALNYPDEFTNRESIGILIDWWMGQKEQMKICYADKGRLVSHGGLTYHTWVALGSPSTAEEAAQAVNEHYAHRIHHGPCFKLGYRPTYTASPAWADPLMETYPSWITCGDEMPFDQIHSSTSLSSHVGRRKSSDENDPLYYIEDKQLNPAFGSIAIIGGKEMRGVDLNIGNEILPSLPPPLNFLIEKQKIEN